MPKPVLYLANYASLIDAESISSGYKTSEVFDHICEAIGFVLTSRSEAHVQRLLQAAASDHALDEDGDTRTDWVPDWQTDGWQSSDPAGLLGYQTWFSPDLEVRVTLRAVHPLSPNGPE